MLILALVDEMHETFLTAERGNAQRVSLALCLRALMLCFGNPKRFARS